MVSRKAIFMAWTFELDQDKFVGDQCEGSRACTMDHDTWYLSLCQNMILNIGSFKIGPIIYVIFLIIYAMFCVLLWANEGS
jgi:hypothetical protein